MKDFFEEIKRSVSDFRKINGPIRIISHIDCDGLTSASIMTAALQRENINFSLSLEPNLTETILKQLSLEDYKTFVFLDMGSGVLEKIKQYLPKRSIFILDHHHPQNMETQFHHINPHLFGIDGSIDISGAGIAYFFAKFLNEKNTHLAHIAMIGIVGDMQEKNGLSELNKMILDDAVKSGKLEIKIGLKIFGSQTKPLSKLLLYSTDPYIPGVTGNEEGVEIFLQELKISPDKKLVQLTQEETKELTTAIIIKRLGSEKNPEDVIGPVYLLKDEPEESPTKDVKEFSTLLNSCGRLGKYSVGIGACLNDPNSKQKAIDILFQYRLELINGLNWFYANRNSSVIMEKHHFVLINAENRIRSTIIGTVTSMISNSNLYPSNTILVSMAYTPEGEIKISIRTTSRSNINLKEVLNTVTRRLGVESGGHDFAAGSIIPMEKEQDFINAVMETLG